MPHPETGTRGFVHLPENHPPCWAVRRRRPSPGVTPRPSRQRSPMPQKMLIPLCLPTTLWISSVITTVLPTPAPPKRARPFPPRSRGTSRSMALMPVKKTSCDVTRRASFDGRLVHRTLAEPDRCRITIDGLPEDVKHTAQKRFAHRCHERLSVGQDQLTTMEPGGGVQRDAANPPFVNMDGGFDANPSSSPERISEWIGGRASGNSRSTTLPRTDTICPWMVVSSRFWNEVESIFYFSTRPAGISAIQCKMWSWMD